MTALVSGLVITVPLGALEQFGFGLLTLLAALWIRHSVKGQLGSMFLISLS
ncbi:hypothetical protein ACVBEH_19650 [Roseateles sp. GG27B]